MIYVLTLYTMNRSSKGQLLIKFCLKARQAVAEDVKEEEHDEE